jgi:hypothetical protein
VFEKNQNFYSFFELYKYEISLKMKTTIMCEQDGNEAIRPEREFLAAVRSEKAPEG